MIIDNGKYYLYRYIRLDKNEVFYIGVGTKRRGIFDYQRAYSKHGRNKHWKNITNKTLCKVEIVLESDSYEFILKKEIEFIALYGRKDLKKGTLCNLTDGGEGNKGYIKTKEERKRISERQVGKCTEKQKEVLNLYRPKAGKDHPRRKFIFQYSSSGLFIKRWDSRTEIVEKTGFNIVVDSNTLSYGFQWKSKYLGEKIKCIIPKDRKKATRKIICYDINNNPLMCFYGIKNAFTELNISRCAVKESLNNKVLKPKKYIFKYADSI